MDAKVALLESYKMDEVFLPMTNDLIASFKKSCKEVDIEIVEQERVSEKVVMFKLKVTRGTFSLFQLGAITHINSTIPPNAQALIDNYFKDKLQ